MKAVALEQPTSALAADADSVSSCLSKGLAATVGSVVSGSRAFIDEARRMRKILGGGMRQAGVLAAAGIVVLTEMVDRPAEDHANAQKLARALAGIDGIIIDPEQVKTNIVFFEINTAKGTPEELARRLDTQGVRVLPSGLRQLRAVIHYHITATDVDNTLAVVNKAMR